MLSLYQAVRLSFKLYQLDIDHVESYKGFSERFDGRWKSPALNEPQIREAYDQWRRDILKKEVRAEFEKTYVRALLAEYLKDRPRQINVVAMVLLALALLFPPYYLTAGDQSVSMGLAFAFDKHVGRIDSMYLLCEIGGIIAMSWFAHRLVRMEASQ